MGAYNFTRMMTIERKMKFRSVEIKGVTSLLLFALFELLSCIVVYFLLSKILGDTAIFITMIYALICFVIFTILQSIKIEEHFYKWLYKVLPKNVDLTYVQDEMFLQINFKRKGVVDFRVYKTNYKRRKTEHSA